MKPSYSNIKPATGAQNSGLCEVKIIPREWLQANPVIDFATGKIVTALSLLPGKDFLTLQFTADSYVFDEKPKGNRAGSFYEVMLKGTVNRVDATDQQTIETLRYHEFVALVKTRDKRRKLVGTKDAGMIIQTIVSSNNSGGGIEIGTLELQMEAETLSPFYEV